MHGDRRRSQLSDPLQDFSDVKHPEYDRLDRKSQPRMPWHDIHMSIHDSTCCDLLLIEVRLMFMVLSLQLVQCPTSLATLFSDGTQIEKQNENFGCRYSFPTIRADL